ncbi:MAG TPA: hypothetical protein VEB63_02960 [Chitinophagaceae bacterium]|nr:hypothetical protein [Chitinophagaceae bacterium]
MKNLRARVIGVCLMLSGLSATAQHDPLPINEPDYNRPKLFQSLPTEIPVNAVELNQLLSEPVGKVLSVNLSDRADVPFRLDGQVVGASNDAQLNLETLNLRTSNYPGAMLTISRTRKPEGGYRYIGRLLSFQHGDLYELQERNGRLVLVKRNFYDLVNE